MDIKLTREEQETIIRGNAGSKEWEVVTADPVMIRYMESRGYQPDDRKNPWGYKSYSVTGRPTIRQKTKKPKSQAQIDALLKTRLKLKHTEGYLVKTDQLPAPLTSTPPDQK